MAPDPPPQLLNLTLKVLYMLFGEDFIIMKKSGGRLAVKKSAAGSEDRGGRSPARETEKSNRKILDVANKITELLSGEAPVRRQDVAVYFAMEEPEQLHEEGMMEDQAQLTSPGSPDGLHQYLPLHQDCAEEDDDIVITVQTSNYWSADDQVMVTYLENFLEISTCEEDLGKNPLAEAIDGSSAHAEDLSRTIIKSALLEHNYALTYAKAKSLLYKEGFRPDPTPDSMTGIKVEHLGQGEDYLQHYNGSTPIDSIEYTTVRIKEDTYSYDEEDLQHVGISMPDECGQYRPLHIKEEPKEPLPYYSTYTSSDPIQYNLPHIKEEPLTYEVEVPPEIELYTDETFSSKKLSLLQKTSYREDHPFPCDVCHKRFKQKSGLGMHIKMHAKEERFACPDCGRRFISQSKLQDHQKIHEEKQFSCGECGKQFSKLSNLSNHQKIHATKNPFSCGECGKQFVSNNNLHRHQRKHSDEALNNEEFYCLECGKTFTHKTAFRKHQRYHTGNNPYPCTDCGRRFIKRINLVKHQRLHTRKNLHSCQECGKFFMSSAYLLRHKNSHTKKKRFCSCSVCGKYFLSSVDLIIHERVHKAEKLGSTSEWRDSFIQKLGFVIQERSNVDEKPYSCPECGEFFERKLHLIRHQKTHVMEKS